MVKKYQQGGQLTDTQQQGLQYLAQMYAQQTGKDPQQDQEGFMQFVQQLAQQAGVQDIGQLLDMIYQQAQGQAQAARRGAKLNYLKKLTNRCPEGTELMYFKAGGTVCSKCVAKEKVQSDKCGNKVKKNCGSKKMFQKGEKIVKDQEPAGPINYENAIYAEISEETPQENPYFHGGIPFPSNRKNQKQNNNFYDKVKKSHVGQYSEKEIREAYNRALKGK